MRSPTKPDPILNKIFRGYRVLRKVATGGMGAVYVGEQLSLGRRVAIKVLYKNLHEDPTCIERFRREALAVAQIVHPNIVQVFDVFEEGDRHFMIMEYVKGESLLATLRRRKKLDVPFALRLLVQCASALDAAHKKGIIHRDIKPGNLLIATSGQVKVADFGIVKMVADDANLTQTGYILGTPYYLSPEQAMDGETDRRSDIYSLGATFYEMITGKRPFAGRSAAETIRRHIENELIPPSELNPDIPPWVDDIVARMMEKRSEDRYSSCRELIQEVKRQFEASRARPARRPNARPPRREAPHAGGEVDAHDGNTVMAQTATSQRAVKVDARPGGNGHAPKARPPFRVERRTPKTAPLPLGSGGAADLDRLMQDVLDPEEDARLLDRLIDEEIDRTASVPVDPFGTVAVLAPTTTVEVACPPAPPIVDESPARSALRLVWLVVGLGAAFALFKIGEMLL